MMQKLDRDSILIFRTKDPQYIQQARNHPQDFSVLIHPLTDYTLIIPKELEHWTNWNV